MRIFGFLLSLVFLLVACGDDVYTPKPRSYPRVFFPERSYQTFDTSLCAFRFQYPAYTEIQQENSYFTDSVPSDCWFDVYYPDFDGRLHFTYYPIESDGKDLERLRQDAFELADWHNQRANYIDELLISKPNGVSGIAFDIDGPAASPFQFFLTDSTQHFVRGALYFNTQARADSLAPVIDFVKEDILALIESFEWR